MGVVATSEIEVAQAGFGAAIGRAGRGGGSFVDSSIVDKYTGGGEQTEDDGEAIEECFHVCVVVIFIHITTSFTQSQLGRIKASQQKLIMMIRTTALDLLGAVQLLGHNQPNQLVRKDQRRQRPDDISSSLELSRDAVGSTDDHRE